MFRKIAVSLFALLICQTIIAAEKVTFEMNQVTIEAKENGVEISWFCQEPNMEYVKKFYSKPRWNVFTGEALEIHFTPYSSSAAGRIAFPYYRMLVNPSGRSLTAFLTPDWSSAGVYPEIEKLDKEKMSLEGRLKNKNFVEKAPKELIEETQARADELNAQINVIK